jgi:nitroreductase
MTPPTSSAAANPPVPDTELTRLLAARGTVRNFKPDPVPEAWVDAIVEYGMRAPTSSNREEYSVIVVHDPATRQALAKIADGQQHIIDCPLYFAICADQNRVAHAVGMHGKDYVTSGFDSGLVTSLDAAMLGLTMSYVADSFGLSSVMIGAMRNAPVEVAKLLKLPPRCYVVYGLCVGWAKTPPRPKPRHDVAAVIHHDVYDPKAHAPAISAYDRDLAGYYRARGTQTPDAAWTQVMAERFSKSRRQGLRQELASLGFPFE